MRFQRLIQLACLSALAASSNFAAQNIEEIHNKALRALREQPAGSSSVDPAERLRLRLEQSALEPRLLELNYAGSIQMAQQSSRSVEEDQRRALEALRNQQRQQSGASTAPAPQSQPSARPPAAQQAPSSPAPRGTPPPAARSADNISPTVREEQERALRALRSQPADPRAIETRADRLSAPQPAAPSGSTPAQAPSTTAPRDRANAAATTPPPANPPRATASEPVRNTPNLSPHRQPTLEERAQQRRALEALRTEQRQSQPPQQPRQAATPAPRTTPPSLAPQIRSTPSGRARASADASALSQPTVVISDPNRPKSRRDKLADLLEEYKADKLTPEQYQQRRQQILSQPE